MLFTVKDIVVIKLKKHYITKHFVSKRGLGQHIVNSAVRQWRLWPTY